MCSCLGVLVAPEKTEGPSSVITFLGSEINTLAGQLPFPRGKLLKLQASLWQWIQPGNRSLPRRSRLKRDLLSLIGLLHHVTKVVRPGRAFLRNLINVVSVVPALDHHVHLSLTAKADLCWWGSSLQLRNGVSVLHTEIPAFTLESDASGS